MKHMVHSYLASKWHSRDCHWPPGAAAHCMPSALHSDETKSGTMLLLRLVLFSEPHLSDLHWPLSWSPRWVYPSGVRIQSWIHCVDFTTQAHTFLLTTHMQQTHAWLTHNHKQIQWHILRLHVLGIKTKHWPFNIDPSGKQERQKSPSIPHPSQGSHGSLKAVFDHPGFCL